MQIEYEATFVNVNKDEIRKRLQDAGAELVKSEFLQKRVIFHLPIGHEIEGGWLRVRDEQDKITMSLKVINGDKIENQKETILQVDNFDEAVSFLLSIGCRKKSYQETKREIWILDNVEICIDEWPFLSPFVEVEGISEEVVKNVSEKIGFKYDLALFCGVATLYSNEYGIPYDMINNEIPEITFSMDNPMLKFVK